MESMRLHAGDGMSAGAVRLGGESVTAGDNLLRQTRDMTDYNC